MKKICVFPGSFDPVTVGHLDLIERASKIFDEVVVAVLHNPAKIGRFPMEKRIELLEKVCKQIPNVSCDCFEGLLVDYMKKRGATVVVRGLRGVRDFESECQMAQLNHEMAPEVETLFLTTAPAYTHISSSAVREIGMFGGDVTPYVPPAIAQEVAQLLKPQSEC